MTNWTVDFIGLVSQPRSLYTVCFNSEKKLAYTRVLLDTSMGLV